MKILRSYPISRWFSKAMLDYHRLYPLMPVIIKDLSHLQKPQHQWVGAEPEMRARETDYGNDSRVLRYNSKSNSNSSSSTLLVYIRMLLVTLW